MGATSTMALLLLLQVAGGGLIACEALNLSPLPSLSSLSSSPKPLIGRVKAGRDTNLTVSSLGFGTWSWGNRLLWDYDPSQDGEIYDAYRTVRDAGATLFDTADSYGTTNLNGRAEILLGEFERRYLAERTAEAEAAATAGGGGGGGDFWAGLFGGSSGAAGSSGRPAPPLPQQVATKFAPYPWRLTRRSVLRAARESLSRLEQDRMAIAQLHWSTKNYLPQQEPALWDGVADVYDAGLCDAVGVSNYGPVQLSRFASRMEERGVPLATAQVQYSLLTYGAARDMAEACDGAGCALIAYSPLCLGLLTGKYNVDNLPRDGNPRRQLFRELLPSASPVLKTLEAVADEYGRTMSQTAVNWAMRKGAVPIPGARDVRQAQENLGATGWELGEDAVLELDRAALSVTKPMIQNIFQTI